MSHSHRFLLIALAAAATLSPAAPAQADTLLQDAPGARNLAAGGGYHAWAAPAGDGRWRLTVRAPDGTVTTPAIAAFGAAPDPSFGSSSTAIDGRRLLVVYSRCDGGSTVRGCDVFGTDVRTGKEEAVPAPSTRSYSETSPQLSFGRYVAVRRGGPRPGLYSFGRTARRITTTTPGDIAYNGSRVAYGYRSGVTFGVALWRLSGNGKTVILASGRPAAARSLVITRYRAGWLEGARVFQTTRFGGSGGPHSPQTQQGNRSLPATTDTVATDSSTITHYLDQEGLKRITPPLFG